MTKTELLLVEADLNGWIMENNGRIQLTQAGRRVLRESDSPTPPPEPNPVSWPDLMLHAIQLGGGIYEPTGIPSSKDSINFTLVTLANCTTEACREFWVARLADQSTRSTV